MFKPAPDIKISYDATEDIPRKIAKKYQSKVSLFVWNAKPCRCLVVKYAKLKGLPAQRKRRA